MFGDGSSGGSGDESGCGGDVEGAAGIAAGAAGVGQAGSLCVAEREGGGGGAHGVDETCDLSGGFPTGCERAEEGGDLDVGELAGEDLLHEGAGVCADEGGAAFGDLLEVGLGRHRLKRSRWRL